jgi:hypothetical protein
MPDVFSLTQFHAPFAACPTAPAAPETPPFEEFYSKANPKASVTQFLKISKTPLDISPKLRYGTYQIVVRYLHQP